MADKIGGFFASLKLESDEASFRKGMNALQGISGLLKAVASIKVAKEIAEFVGKMAELNQAQAMLNVTAFQANATVDALKEWSNALRVTTGDADGFVNALIALRSNWVRLGRGDPLNVKAVSALGQLGLDVEKTMNESSDRQAKDILTAAARAKTAKEQADAAERVRDLLGEAGMKFYIWLTQSGDAAAKLEQILGKARDVTMGSAEDIKAARGPAEDWNQMTVFAKEAKDLFAMKFMMAIDPALERILKYIVEHKADISAAIASWADTFGTLADALSRLLPALNFAIGGIQVIAELGSAGINLLTGKGISDKDMKRMSGIVDKWLWFFPGLAEETRAMDMYDMLKGKGMTPANLGFKGKLPGDHFELVVKLDPGLVSKVYGPAPFVEAQGKRNLLLRGE